MVSYRDYINDRTKSRKHKSTIGWDKSTALHEDLLRDGDFIFNPDTPPHERHPVYNNFLKVNYGEPNEVLEWDSTDSEEQFFENLKNSTSLKTLQESGYLENPILYKFNSLGFRSEEFTSKKGLVSLGCSFTFGTGLHLEETWGYKLASKLNLPHYNLGRPGSSIDTAFRFLLMYHDKINIDTVAIFTPNIQRREEAGEFVINPLKKNPEYHYLNLGWWSSNYFDDKDLNKRYNYIDKFKDSVFLSTPSSRLNYVKTLYAIKHLCDKNNYKFIDVQVENIRSYLNYLLFEDKDPKLSSLCKARDLRHWSKETHDFIAEIFYNELTNNNKIVDPSEYGLHKNI